MPSFSDSFWTNGYKSGIDILLEKLHQGCVENDEVLSMAAARADAEEAYGNRLREITVNHDIKKSGFARDDGASLRKAYEGIVHEMGEEGRNHTQVAENIRRMVLVPFGKWAEEHSQRIEYSQGVLKSKVKTYDKHLNEVQKCQKRYFNKCRVLEDLKESGANIGENGNLTEEDESIQDVSTEQSSFLLEPVQLGDEDYTPEAARDLICKMLDEIPQNDVKVPILGTYGHVSTGANVVAWFQEHLDQGQPHLSKAEQFGQSLINEGFLRLVGQVGNNFANSSVMHYQWRRKAYQIAGRENELEQRNIDLTPLVGEYLGGTIQNYINNPYPDETPEKRLVREVSELDKRYRQAVQNLDDVRCNLEESMIDHCKFLERCESDRLKAIKAVFLDFLAALSNVVPAIQSSVDKVLLYQETVHPENDLRYILESYQTGLFSPKVTVYDNYYNSAEDQTFGVDLELRCRGDRKRVPLVVSGVLSYMDQLYPEMENDEVRLKAWTVSVPLKVTHQVRRAINTMHPFSRDVLTQYEPPVVVSVLKLYLVELPDSVVPSTLYDIIRTIYSQHGNDETSKARVSAIQNTFAQMRVSNIATLDALTSHLGRLISIANASQEYQAQLAQELSYCILRPRVQSALTVGDRHSYRLMLDLLQYRDQIFTGLKRNNSNDGPGSNISVKKHSNVTKSETISRRPSLQNRMEALSLKIRNRSVSGRREKIVETVEEEESEVENGSQGARGGEGSQIGDKEHTAIKDQFGAKDHVSSKDQSYYGSQDNQKEHGAQDNQKDYATQNNQNGHENQVGNNNHEDSKESTPPPFHTPPLKSVADNDDEPSSPASFKSANSVEIISTYEKSKTETN